MPNIAFDLQPDVMRRMVISLETNRTHMVESVSRMTFA